ncbi:MAG: hypothetical protein IJS28_00190 [Synergistaceae bacterium]|nr:hypothetical protein [Synergistaceae bacterium]
MRKEGSTKLAEYVSEETAKRRKFSSVRLLKSKTSFFAARHLYECAGKTPADFEKLKVLRDEDMADAVRTILKRLEIKDFAELKKWAAEEKANADTLVQLQMKGRQGVSNSDFKAILRLKEKTSAPYLLTLMWLFSAKCSDDYPAKKGLAEFLEIIHPNDIGRLYKVLLLELAPKSKDDDDSDSQEAASVKDSGKYEAQVEELRAELESAYIRLNASEENFERFQQESAELAVVDVLAKMNSQEAGQLLDQFAKSEQTLRQLSSSGYTVPKELSSVSLCVRMFMRTMRSVFRISPVHVMGEKLKLTLEQAERYDYSGSDFADDNEVKTVEVISPGWRYGKEIFSLPKVIECSE